MATGASGNLDLFSGSAPDGPTGHLRAIVARGEQSGSGSTLLPNPCCLTAKGEQDHLLA